MKGPCKENGRNMKSNGRNVTGKMNVTWTDLLCASLKCFVWIYCGQTPTPTNSLHNSILGAFCLRWVVSDIFEPTWNALNLSFFFEISRCSWRFCKMFLRCLIFFLSQHICQNAVWEFCEVFQCVVDFFEIVLAFVWGVLIVGLSHCVFQSLLDGSLRFMCFVTPSGFVFTF